MITPELADPNLAFLLLVIGGLALLWELHAPGMIVPGAIGALLVLAGLYGLYLDSPSWYGAMLLIAAALLIFIELRVYTHVVSGVAGAILLAFGAILLLPGPRHIAPALAIATSAAIGIITVFLGVLGIRVTKTKHLTGVETLVGEVGVSRTDLNPDGTVFVVGAYWKAHSEHAIAAGQRVRIERVEDLLLHVKEA